MSDTDTSLGQEPTDLPPQPQDAAPAYDPSAHTVDDVLAYLGEHPEAVAEVQGLETDGKARKGILSYEAPAPEDVAASSPEPLIQEGTEEYDRQVIYPEDHPDAVPVAPVEDEG